MPKKRKEKNKLFFKIITFILLSVFLIACGQEKTKTKKIIKPKKILKKRLNKNKSLTKITKENKKLHKFIYSVSTERDPFKPFFMKVKMEENIGDDIPETPLTMYSLAQYKLKAILTALGKSPLAMVETSDNLGLFFTIGDYIGKEHYKVVSIENNIVKLEKKKRGLLNEVKIVTKELTLDNEGE
jgi:Tfp pilus assembly protein PilP